MSINSLQKILNGYFSRSFLKLHLDFLPEYFLGHWFSFFNIATFAIFNFIATSLLSAMHFAILLH